MKREERGAEGGREGAHYERLFAQLLLQDGQQGILGVANHEAVLLLRHSCLHTETHFCEDLRRQRRLDWRARERPERGQSRTGGGGGGVRDARATRQGSFFHSSCADEPRFLSK